VGLEYRLKSHPLPLLYIYIYSAQVRLIVDVVQSWWLTLDLCKMLQKEMPVWSELKQHYSPVLSVMYYAGIFIKWQQLDWNSEERYSIDTQGLLIVPQNNKTLDSRNWYVQSAPAVPYKARTVWFVQQCWLCSHSNSLSVLVPHVTLSVCVHWRSKLLWIQSWLSFA